MILTLQEIQLEDRRKFSRLGKEYFFFDPKNEFDPLKESQKYHKFFSLNLPDDISEIFLSKENITLYLLDYYKFAQMKKISLTPSKEIIRDYLFKWFLSKTIGEKEISFLSLLKFSKANNLSFYDELMLTSFLIRERKSIKDLSLIESKFDHLTTLENLEQNPYLTFLMNLIKSIYHIELGQFETALYTLNDIENNKGFSPNATFYKTQLALEAENIELAESLVDSIIDFDLKRLEFAVNNFNLKAYDLVLNNSFLQKYFLLDAGPLLSEKIGTLNITVQKKFELLPKISTITKSLAVKEFTEFTNESSKSKLTFVDLIMARYGNSKSYFFLATLDYLHSNTKKIITELLQNVEHKYLGLIDELLKRYDDKVNTNKDLLKTLEENNIDFQKKDELKAQKTMSEYEARVSDEIKYYEHQLEYFESDSNQSSFNTLKNSLIYSGLFSLFVLLSGGFAEYSNSYLTDIANIGSVISIVIMGGMKWGAISFIIGVFISIFMLISTMHSRYTAKSNLIQRISNLNVEKDRGKATIKEKYEQRKKHQQEKYEISKTKLLEEIESYRITKEEERLKLEEKFLEEKTALTNPLEELLKL